MKTEEDKKLMEKMQQNNYVDSIVNKTLKMVYQCKVYPLIEENKILKERITYYETLIATLEKKMNLPEELITLANAPISIYKKREKLLFYDFICLKTN